MIRKEYTSPKLLTRQYEKYGDEKIAMREKDYGIWRTYTWKDYYGKVKYFSLGLVSLGLKRGDRVSILGENEPEWYWAELAAQAAGGVIIGIFVDCMPSEIKYYVEHSDSRIVIAHDQEQVDKVLEVKGESRLIEKVIYWDSKGLWNYHQPFILSFNEVIDLGRAYEKTHPNLFEENVEKGSADDVALILYTSGTTGLPKGAMVTYRNILAVAQAVCEREGWNEDYNYLSFVPPAWIAEQGLGVGAQLIAGSTVSFPEDAETVQEDMRELAPSIIFYSPRLWELTARMIQAKMVDADFLKRWTYNLFMPVGYKRTDMKMAGERVSLFWELVFFLAEVALFRPIKDKLGMSKVKWAVTGGTLISPRMIGFFRAIGINVKSAYGCSEGGVITAIHRDDDVKLATAGSILRGTEYRISDDRELLVRGVGLFKGYYKNPEDTAKQVRGGWYQSGDFAHIDDDGHLVIIDRIADLRELLGGHRFSPQYIEAVLRFCPYIKDALVVGSKDKDYVSALVQVDRENVGRWAEKEHIAYTTFADLSQKHEIIALMTREIEKVNNLLPEYSRIRRFVSLSKEFDPDEADLTRTRKLRRSYVESRERNIIDAIYANKPELTVRTPVVYRDGRKGIVETSLRIYTLY